MKGMSFYQNPFMGRVISKEYLQNMNDEANVALKNINKYFSKENIIYKIRNSLAFHYNPQKLDSGFINAPDDLDVYIEKTGNSNNLFYFGEVVAGRALLSESGNLNDESENPYQKLIHEIFEVGRWFSTAVNHILRRFIEKHKEKIWDGVATEVEFENLVSVLDVHIPWFTDMSKVEEGMDGQ
jgi:hypothetical protein